MQPNDFVRVYPLGSPERAGSAKVIMLSGNGRSIAVAFGDGAPFQIVDGGGAAVHPEHGLMLLAGRETPDGPWKEVFGDGRFVIEDYEQ